MSNENSFSIAPTLTYYIQEIYDSRCIQSLPIETFVLMYLCLKEKQTTAD